MYDMTDHQEYMRHWGDDTYMVLFTPIESQFPELASTLERFWDDIHYEDVIQVAFGKDHFNIASELEHRAAHCDLHAEYCFFMEQAVQLYSTILPPELRLECFEFMEVLTMHPGLKLLRLICNVSEIELETKYGINACALRRKLGMSHDAYRPDVLAPSTLL